MDLRRVIDEYLHHSDLADKLSKTIAEYKGVLVSAIDADGDVDDKGNKFLPVGEYLLQRQRRESTPSLDLRRAEAWAKEKGIWDQVSHQIEVLDEDALLGYIYDNRDADGLEEEFQSLFTESKVTYAFIKPKRVQNYEY